MGVSGMLYYTTDASAIPAKPFHYARLTVDVSGNLLSLFNSLMPVNEYDEHLIWNTAYAQYVRGELQLGKTFRFGWKDRHSLAMRFMVGVGFGYGNSSAQPIDKMFYCGGSTSMRGWQARTLGPGTDQILSDLFVIPTQIGESKLEANLEYRFPIVWKFEGALFTDAGNIWEFGSAGSHGIFTWDSIALNWGLGLRLNMDVILLRLDAGFRVYDPGRDEGLRWLQPKQWFQSNGMAIHFGVGYPF